MFIDQLTSTTPLALVPDDSTILFNYSISSSLNYSLHESCNLCFALLLFFLFVTPVPNNEIRTRIVKFPF